MPYHFVFTEWFDRNLKFLRKHNPTLRKVLVFYRKHPNSNFTSCAAQLFTVL